MTDDTLPAIQHASPLAAILSDADRLADYPAEKVRTLWDIFKEDQDRQAKVAFTKAFVAVKKEMTPVAKRGRNTHTKSKHAKLEHVIAMLEPLMQKHGFGHSVSFTEGREGVESEAVLELLHEGGHSKQYFMPAPGDFGGFKGGSNKTKIQGIGSTMTYVERYLLVAVFGVQLVDADDDGNASGGVGPGHEKINPDQQAEVHELIMRSGADRRLFYEHFWISELPELRVNRLAEAKQMLNERMRRLGISA